MGISGIRLPCTERVQDDHAGGESDEAAGERNQHSFGEQLAKNQAAPRPERQAQGHFFGAIGGSRSEQAAEIGARCQQDEAGKQHQASHERPCRPAEHIPNQARTREGELNAVIVRGVGFCQPGAECVQIGGGLLRRHTGLEATR